MTTDLGMKRIFPVGYDNGFGDETDVPGQRILDIRFNLLSAVIFQVPGLAP
ncbi:hypothetical protein QUF72_01525 [Desulfobacterales bacterium HSG2]|nr:hypothetical protein [Desulfobacterales bacterium HSG2]